MAYACNAELLDALPRQAYRAALAWLGSGWADHSASVTGQLVFAQCDPNLANHLWDGHSVHLVDFEASGRGDRATELADWAPAATSHRERARATARLGRTCAGSRATAGPPR